MEVQPPMLVAVGVGVGVTDGVFVRVGVGVGVNDIVDEFVAVGVPTWVKATSSTHKSTETPFPAIHWMALIFEVTRPPGSWAIPIPVGSSRRN